MDKKESAKEVFDRNRKLEEKFIPEMKQILANHFIVRDTVQDLERGTDFLTFTIKAFTVGARLRRFAKIRFNEEFTLRWSWPSGIETEIHKIMKGYVDFLLYAFADPPEERIIQYFIADLEVFRNHPEIKPIEIKENDPPDSKFAVYRIDQFPSDFVVDSNPKGFWKSSDSIGNHTPDIIKTERKLTPSDFM